MTDLKKDHIAGAGAGAATTGTVGAVIGGMIAGPPGVALGAVIGTALGAVGGQKIAAAMEGDDNLGHFEQIYDSQPYYVAGMAWDDYAPAYRLGLNMHTQLGGQPFEQVEQQVAASWPDVRGASRLEWAQAREAVAHASRSLTQVEEGQSQDTPKI